MADDNMIPPKLMCPHGLDKDLDYCPSCFEGFCMDGEHEDPDYTGCCLHCDAVCDWIGGPWYLPNRKPKPEWKEVDRYAAFAQYNLVKGTATGWWCCEELYKDGTCQWIGRFPSYEDCRRYVERKNAALVNREQ